MVVQSAAAYAFMLLIYAIAVVIPTPSDEVTFARMYPLIGYVAEIFTFTAVRPSSVGLEWTLI